MIELMIRKRVRSYQTPTCVNPRCGSRRVRYWRENSRYRAFKCENCGHYAVEGDQEAFEQDETAIRQAAIKREMGRELMEKYG